MWRLVFLGIIVWFTIYVLKQRAHKINKQTLDNTKNNTEHSKSTENTDSTEDTDRTEDMVQCASCQVHLPRSDAFLVSNKFYCSKAHIQEKCAL